MECCSKMENLQSGTIAVLTMELPPPATELYRSKLIRFCRLALVVRRRWLGFFKVFYFEVVLFQQIVQVCAVFTGKLRCLADVSFRDGQKLYEVIALEG